MDCELYIFCRSSPHANLLALSRRAVINRTATPKLGTAGNPKVMCSLRSGFASARQIFRLDRRFLLAGGALSAWGRELYPVALGAMGRVPGLLEKWFQ